MDKTLLSFTNISSCSRVDGGTCVWSLAVRFSRMALLAAIAGCAAQTQTYWEKPGSTRADFDADMGQCRAQAFGVPGAMGNLMQVAIVQSQCMQGKGWYTVER